MVEVIDNGDRHRGRGPAADLRAVLSGRPVALARHGRDGAGAVDRQAHRPGARRARSRSRARRGRGRRSGMKFPAAVAGCRAEALTRATRRLNDNLENAYTPRRPRRAAYGYRLRGGIQIAGRAGTPYVQPAARKTRSSSTCSRAWPSTPSRRPRTCGSSRSSSPTSAAPLQRIREEEHAADELAHTALDRLDRTFITPVRPRGHPHAGRRAGRHHRHDRRAGQAHSRCST